MIVYGDLKFELIITSTSTLYFSQQMNFFMYSYLLRLFPLYGTIHALV